MSDRRQSIISASEDLMGDFLYYDRKGDEDLRVGQIEEAIRQGEISIDEIVSIFKSNLEKAVG